MKDSTIKSLFRMGAALLVSMVMPLIITYSIPYYWINVTGIFIVSMIVHWIIDFIVWSYKKIKGRRKQA